MAYNFKVLHNSLRYMYDLYLHDKLLQFNAWIKRDVCNSNYIKWSQIVINVKGKRVIFY